MRVNIPTTTYYLPPFSPSAYIIKTCSLPLSPHYPHLHLASYLLPAMPIPSSLPLPPDPLYLTPLPLFPPLLSPKHCDGYICLYIVTLVFIFISVETVSGDGQWDRTLPPGRPGLLPLLPFPPSLPACSLSFPASCSASRRPWWCSLLFVCCTFLSLACLAL